VRAGVRSFAPQYPLWTDGASKRRWIQLPAGARIDATDVDDWQYPVGTRFWKEFSFGGRRVETRMLWKVADASWITVSYAWNEAQTDAELVPEEGLRGVAEVAKGRSHSIPARSDCAACHGAPARPLGFGALQLSTDRDPNAIHGEPLRPGMLTVATLLDEGLLSPARAELVARPPRIAARSPRARAALGYLAANCGSCHDGRGEIAANLPALTWRDLAQAGDDVAAGLVGLATRWQVPGAAEGATVAVDSAEPEQSAILARMRSRSPSSQMPPLGTVLRDHEALEAIAAWIAADLGAERYARMPRTTSP
jgi:cytochrome c553